MVMVMENYYTGKGGLAEELATKEMEALDDIGLLFSDEMKLFGDYVMIGTKSRVIGKVSTDAMAGWSPNKVAEITGWFGGKYIQQLCRGHKIDCGTTESGYLVSAKGIEQLYDKYLKKERRV